MLVRVDPRVSIAHRFTPVPRGSVGAPPASLRNWQGVGRSVSKEIRRCTMSDRIHEPLNRNLQEDKSLA